MGCVEAPDGGIHEGVQFACLVSAVREKRAIEPVDGVFGRAMQHLGGEY